jgi:NADH-quinone oxidoreductase subunit J
VLPISVLFWLLSVLIVFGAVGTVSTKNLLHSVVSAFVSLIAISGFYFILNAEFLGIVQILVYAGAITILVLFVVMVTTAGPGYQVVTEGRASVIMYIAALIFFVFLLSIIYQVEWPAKFHSLKNVTNGLALRIFLQYLLPFEIASILLLAALVGAVVLARRD